MSILVIFRAAGDPKDLLSRYDSTLAAAAATAPVRPKTHYCVTTESGIMLVDLWDSREDVEQAVIKNEAFRRQWDKVAWPREKVEMFEVHNSGWPE